MVKHKTNSSLIEKYNVACPRYTSYPAVPHWDNSLFTTEAWKESVKQSFSCQNIEEGISLYIHLPYCESLCTYCGCNTRITVNHAVELPYINAVLAEWKLYLQLFDKIPVIRELHLGGGTPTFFSPENLSLLINGILADAKVSKDHDFSFEGHPGNTTEAHLQALFKLGFRRVSFGIQDFDPVVQDVINRKQSFEDVKQVTSTARRLGYTSVNFDLVYGLPLQTLASVTDTFEKVKLLNPDRIAFYSYAHVPWVKPGQRKFTELDLPSNKEKRKLYEAGRTILETEGYKEIGMDHFARTNDTLYNALTNMTLHRNFMGYTPYKTNMLIGLGCSSISETPDGFAQNYKTVEKYIETIKNGAFAVFNGHLVTESDQLIGKHILNLMCRYETHKDNDPDFSKALNYLKEMEKDGLVILTEESVKVTEEGKLFIRNICAAFDAHFQKKNSNKPLFSQSI
jgi:oxygen-independent coproporphyrinogen III oxidase